MVVLQLWILLPPFKLSPGLFNFHLCYGHLDPGLAGAVTAAGMFDLEDTYLLVLFCLSFAYVDFFFFFILFDVWEMFIVGIIISANQTFGQLLRKTFCFLFLAWVHLWIKVSSSLAYNRKGFLSEILCWQSECFAVDFWNKDFAYALCQILLWDIPLLQLLAQHYSGLRIIWWKGKFGLFSLLNFQNIIV